VFHIAGLVREETVVVLELSSHQLEFLTRGPHIAVMLNFFQEHLDAYSSYDAYQEAKLNITRYQTDEDFLVFSADDPALSVKVKPFLPFRRAYPCSFHPVSDFGMSLENDRLVFHDGNHHQPVWNIHQDRFLRGSHNLRNIMAAATVAQLLEVGHEDLEDGIATFKGLEHRLEYVGETARIHFYNDSIATIPEACIEAIKAIPGVDTLVAGGFDRGIDYEPLGRFLAESAVNHFILTGDAGTRIGSAIMAAGIGSKTVHYISHFDEFAKIAFRVTRPGYVCLLSPAAASYDEFRNFEERGRRFRALTAKEAL
jgi:UDP-N-acetylmuramoylalanine--D-glutamate ligase